MFVSAQGEAKDNYGRGLPPSKSHTWGDANPSLKGTHAFVVQNVFIPLK